MSRQSLLAYLSHRTDEYEGKAQLGMTSAKGGDLQAFFPPICERPLKHSGYDVFGVHWSAADPSCHYTQNQTPIITDIESWEEEVRFPVIEHFDWGFVEKQAQNFDRENKLIITTLAVGPFERTSSLSSFEDCLVNAQTNPNEYTELINAIADYKIKIIEQIFAYAQPDIVNLHDDWGTAISTFFRPEYWRAVIKPATQRMYDAIHERGALVSQHSDGAIYPLIPDLIEMGADIWEGAREMPDKVEDIRKQYGDRLCLVVPDDPPRSTATIPDVSTMPLNYQPYQEVPEFLYVR